MSRPSLLFMPGSSGAASFWLPVGELLPPAWRKRYLDWPGMGSVAPSPNIASYDDLADLVLDRLEEPTALVAQSMGGVVAAKVAIRRPDRVSHLVFTATSGGIDRSAFDLADWRSDYIKAYPHAPAWIFEHTSDLSEELRALRMPVLLVWATRDAISPVAIGHHLAGLMQQARLVEIDSDDHWVVRQHPEQVAGEIARLIQGPA
ncbi:MAG: alpha/beta hydrolase [Alphaproteobacteria bacterium]|nr:alpha/beta hydrolase [Alphaproteobacteria bacterium]